MLTMLPMAAVDAAAPEAQEIEQAIAGLTAADTASNRPFELADRIARLNDPAAQERLQGLLNERMGALFSDQAQEAPPETVGEPSTPVIPPEAQLGAEVMLSSGDIASAIEQLLLGPTATADDLRLRDDVVGRIAQVQNPDERQALLDRLAERERLAEEAPEPMAPPVAWEDEPTVLE